jgi:NADPH:quinone reductase-like Zn-dependent oxidoreductase
MDKPLLLRLSSRRRQDLVAVPRRTALPIPYDLDLGSAACLGVAAVIAAMTFWKLLRVPREIYSHMESSTQRLYLLICDGSTVTGQFTVEIGVQGGREVIAVT